MKPLTLIPLSEQGKLNPHLLDIISYRKSGLSLNHIIGCSLDCAYCVRHFFDNFEMKEPQMICTNEVAVQSLLQHSFFIRNITPIQLFNRATDPFLSGVKKHTHEVLTLMDNAGLRNPVLLITRAKVTKEDIQKLEALKNLKVSLLVTYSGITNSRIEPIAKSGITVKSIQTISQYKSKTKLILYWRPIVAGWNDDAASFERVFKSAKGTDAIVFTGYYHRPENFAYLNKLGIAPNLGEFGRRKFLPAELEQNILTAYKASGIGVPLFRKTSCGVTYAHNMADYNGHWGVNEICDICPSKQKELCRTGHQTPSPNDFKHLLDKYEYETPFLIEDGHIWTTGLGEEKRYHLQHTLGFQIWDIEKPHFKNQHGRSLFGQVGKNSDDIWYKKTKKKFLNEVLENDD